MTAPRNRWALAWVAFGLAFLVLELTAAASVGSGDTLSENVWTWFPSWWWWTLPAGLLLSLAAHLSPKRTSVVPVAGFGGGFCVRVAWVQWGPFDWLMLLGLIANVTALAVLAWLALRPGDYLCVDKEPFCWHRTWLGAWVHRVGFRESRRLP